MPETESNACPECGKPRYGRWCEHCFSFGDHPVSVPEPERAERAGSDIGHGFFEKGKLIFFVAGKTRAQAWIVALAAGFRGDEQRSIVSMKGISRAEDDSNVVEVFGSHT